MPRRLTVVLCLLLFSCWAWSAEEDDEIELERTVYLSAELLDVRRVPSQETRAVARFRVTRGSYRGSIISLAYDFAFPVRLRSWDIHDQAYKRIGGARVTEPGNGRWDLLSRDGGPQPVRAIELQLVQHDLNEDEERRRWHFKRIEALWRLGDPRPPVEEEPE
jgi:hypothetical protein